MDLWISTVGVDVDHANAIVRIQHGNGIARAECQPLFGEQPGSQTPVSSFHYFLVRLGWQLGQFLWQECCGPTHN